MQVAIVTVCHMCVHIHITSSYCATLCSTQLFKQTQKSYCTVTVDSPISCMCMSVYRTFNTLGEVIHNTFIFCSQFCVFETALLTKTKITKSYKQSSAPIASYKVKIQLCVAPSYQYLCTIAGCTHQSVYQLVGSFISSTIILWNV